MRSEQGPQRFAASVLLALACTLVLLPLGTLLLRAEQTRDAPGAAAALDGLPPGLAGSLAWALGIAAVATMLALPLALALRTASLRWLALLGLPLLLPNYLVSFCLTLLVQPQSRLGAWLAVQGQGPLPWLPGSVMQAIAFVGLALWLVPLGTLLLLPACKALPQSCLDSLRLDASPGMRTLATLHMLRSRIAIACGLLALLMLGSAVPLHLANAPTLAVRAWASAVLSPGSIEPWIASAPLLLAACIASVCIARGVARAVARAQQHPSDDAAPRAARGGRLALLPVAFLVLLPLLAAALQVRSASSLLSFAHVTAPALASSAGVAACTGLLLALLLVLAWRAGEAMPRRGAFAVALLLAWALAPGILAGQAWTQLLAALQEHSNDAWTGFAIVLLAHTSRFAGFFCVAGWMLAGLEPRARARARALDHAASARGWALATALGSTRAIVPVLVAAACAGACLSLHEIESTIMLQPPGTGSLGQTMLANLHFARSEELCAGVLFITLAAAVPVACGAGVLWWSDRRA